MASSAGGSHSGITHVIIDTGVKYISAVVRTCNRMCMCTARRGAPVVTMRRQLICGQCDTGASAAAADSKSISGRKNNTVFQLSPYRVCIDSGRACVIRHLQNKIHRWDPAGRCDSGGNCSGHLSFPLSDPFPHITYNVRVQNAEAFPASGVSNAHAMAMCTSAGRCSRGVADMNICKGHYASVGRTHCSDCSGMRMCARRRGAPAVIVGWHLFGRKSNACTTADGTICIASTRCNYRSVFELDPCGSGKNRSRADRARAFPDKSNWRGIVSRSQTFYNSDRHQLTLLQTYLLTYGFRMLNAWPLPVFPIVTEWVCTPALLVV